MEKLAAKGEEAAVKGNIKELYFILKKISGNYRQCNKPVRQRNSGNLLTTQQHKTELDGDMWPVAYDPPGATRHKSSQVKTTFAK